LEGLAHLFGYVTQRESSIFRKWGRFHHSSLVDYLVILSVKFHIENCWTLLRPIVLFLIFGRIEDRIGYSDWHRWRGADRHSHAGAWERDNCVLGEEMNTQVEHLLQQAQQLPPLEQLSLISHLAEQLRHKNSLATLEETSTHGSEEIFRLLTALSDDFMVNGREQLPLQWREDF
jgi:hypothetical protein